MKIAARRRRRAGIPAMKALILVELQDAFLSGGALAVPEGERLFPVANGLQRLFPRGVATQPRDPPDHRLGSRELLAATQDDAMHRDGRAV